MGKRSTKKYEALGFIEALIAIMVVGASSVVLMQIASNTLQNLVQNEVLDTLTQYAVESAEVVQDIANKESLTGTNVFPPVTVDGCYVINSATNEFVKDEATGIFDSYDLSERDEYKDIDVYDNGTADITGDDFFRLVCIDGIPAAVDPDPSHVVTKVVVGQVYSDGEISKGNTVKDYTYFTVIKL